MDQTEKVLKIAISIPTEGHTLPEAYDNHLIMAFRLGSKEQQWKYEKRNPRYEFYWQTTGRLFTPIARECLITEALDGGMDYVVMFDDDMLLPLDIIESLIAQVEKHPEIDIIAPLAFMRSAPHYPVIYNAHEGYDATLHTPYHTNEFVKKYPKDTLIECDAVGFGMVLINLRILKKMKPKYFMSTTGTGEDIFFCYKAKKEADARIFVDTSLKLGHLGLPVVIDEDKYEDYIKKSGIKIDEVPNKYLQDKR